MKNIFKYLSLFFMALFTSVIVYPFFHEAGHSVAAVLVGGKVEEFCLFPLPYVACNVIGVEKSGNIIILTIDTKAPVINVSDIKNQSANNEETIGMKVTVTDKNMPLSNVKPVLNAVVKKSVGENKYSYETVKVDLGTAVTSTNSSGETVYQFTVNNFDTDGYYSFECSALDYAMQTFILPSVIGGSAIVLLVMMFIINPILGAFMAVILIPTIIVAFIANSLYRFYFYYRLSLDINAVCEGDGEETESYVTALALSLITFGAYEIYWTYKLAKRLRANAPRYGFKMLETGKDIAVLNAFSFGFVGTWELIKNTNRVARVYNQSGLAEVVGGVQ